MSDIPTTHKIPDALLGKLLHLSRAPTLYAPACEEAAAEITRLRAALGAAQEQADRYLRHLTAGAQKMREVESALAAAQERERSQALPADDAEMVERVGEAIRQAAADLGFGGKGFNATHIARAALSAMRGEP